MDRQDVFERINYSDVLGVFPHVVLDPGWSILKVRTGEGPKDVREIVVDSSDMGDSWSAADRYFVTNVLLGEIVYRHNLSKPTLAYVTCQFENAYAYNFTRTSSAVPLKDAYVLKAKSGALILIENVPEGE